MKPRSVTRKCRQTGRPITVATAEAVGLDPCDGACAWYTICDDHGGAVGHESRRLAEQWAPYPLEWCEYCMEEQRGPNEGQSPVREG